MTRLLTVITLAAALSTGARAAVISAFAENFESGLARWTDRDPADPHAVIMVDPLDPANHALGFRRVGQAGTIFSTDLIYSSDGKFTVSFDYLGVGGGGDKGGYFGISKDFPGDHQWVAGYGSDGTPVILINDGAWHHYTLTFDSGAGDTVHLMFEDFDGAGPTAGDALFDNIQYNDHRVAPAPLGTGPTSPVPEPSGHLALLGLCSGGLLLRSRSRRVV
jgi:hypothetical protein